LNRFIRIAVWLSASLLLAALMAYFIFFKPVPVRVIERVSPHSVLVGDPIRCEYTVTAPRDTEIEFMDLEPYLEDFDVRDVQTSEEDRFRKKKATKTYILANYKPMSYYLPGMEVKYKPHGSGAWKRAETSGTGIKVKTLVNVNLLSESRVQMSGGMAGASGASGVPGDASMGMATGRSRFLDIPIRFEINEIGPPKKIMTITDYLIIAGGAILALAVIFLGALFAVKAAKNRPQVEPTPRQTAVDKLKKLKYKKFLEEGKEKEFCTQLAGILMEFVQAKFNMGETALTCNEFIEALEEVENLGEEHKVFLRERIKLCDLVRFSPHLPDISSLDPELEKERKLVNEIWVG